MFTDIGVNDICIIITGLIRNEYIGELVNMYKNIHNKIISTWIDQDKLLLNILEKNGFTILLNEYPRRITSVNCQNTQVKFALLKAKELGFKFASRFRTDMYIKDFEYDSVDIKLFKDVYYLNNVISSNISPIRNSDTLLRFIDGSRHLYDKITFICGELCHGINLHPNDLLYFGPIDELLVMFDNTEYAGDDLGSDKMIIEEYFKKSVSTILEYKSNINSCIDICVNNNIDFFWNRQIKSIPSLFLVSGHLINNQLRNHRFIIF